MTSTDSPVLPRVRWWPLVAIPVVTALAIAWLQMGETEDRQRTNWVSIVTAVVGAALLLVWLLWFSRLPRGFRRGSAWTLLGALVVFLFLFRYSGMTGDLLPIFEWRWRPAPPVAVAPEGALVPVLETVPGLEDFPQFFGPRRDGVLTGPELDRDWEARPPEELWRIPVGAGWSGIVVAGRRAITQEQHGEDEAVVCYDVVTGQVQWVHRDAARYETPLAGLGPRATPTIDGERVFVQGATGILNCLELATGTVLWNTNILEDGGALLPEWGVAGSPLVRDDVVVVSAGGSNGYSLIGYDKQTGDLEWSGGDAETHWSSVVAGRLGGTEQLLIFNAREVVGHAAEDGRVLWSYPWRGGHPHVSLPLVFPGDRVLISSGYGTGSHMVRVAPGDDGRFEPIEVWSSLSMKAKFTNLVQRDGFVYGLDDGILACVDVATGRRRWKGGRYGHGQVLLVGELLLVTTETGDVVLVDPNPEEFREVTRFSVFDHKSWNPPALAGRYLLVRTDREAACFRLPVQQ